MIDDCFVQRYTSIVISTEGSSCHDMILDRVKLSYLDTPNKIYKLVPWINIHMTMLLETFKDVVLILLYFHVAFKVEPLKFTRLMRGNEEPFGLPHHVIYIIWHQESFPQVMVGIPSISSTLG